MSIPAFVKEIESQFYSLSSFPTADGEALLSSFRFRDAHQRFRLWAGNIGARQDADKKSSMEYRLRDAPQVREEASNVLSELLEALEDLLALLEQPRESHVQEATFIEIGVEEQSDAIPSQVPATDECEELFKIIQGCIRGLFKLSILIRKATKRDRFDIAVQRSDMQFIDDFDIRHIGEKYPKLNDEKLGWLKVRLGRAITQRRQYLSYCRDHRNKLNEAEWVPPEAQASIPADGRSVGIHHETPVYDDNDGVDTAPPPTIMASTTASSLLIDIPPTNDEVDDIDDALSYTTVESEVEDSDETTLHLPTLESLKGTNEEFECPFCRGIQDCRSEKMWRRHAFADLKAYVCCLGKGECDLAMFQDRKSWFSHELRYHRCQWCCIFCDKEPYTSLEKFRNHVRLTHSTVPKERYTEIFRACQEPLALIPAFDCPFCTTWENNLRNKNRDTSESQRPIPEADIILVGWKHFRRHVASHLEQLALFAIRGYVPDDGNSDGSQNGDDETVKASEQPIEDAKPFEQDMASFGEGDTTSKRTKWYERANEEYGKFTKATPLSLPEVEDIIKEGRDLGLSDRDEHLRYFIQQQEQGTFWEQNAKELIAAELINYAQLDTLASQATIVPIRKETLAQIEAILLKQREAQNKINNLFERCKDPDFRKRPKYREVREAIESLIELKQKPLGTMDLEKEQKRHEDWMRRGKKLFGRANAPLHILLQQLKIVEERNEHCFDPNDQPRLPNEPSSRANSPAEDGNRAVFCICRKPEAGMMIECEICHEWYHGKCLKIARGKVKEYDKYTCPICDHRVKIPRDAARPRLEELQVWQDEVETLPFQPEEEDTLNSIINKASEFRDKLSSIVNPIMSSPDDLPVQRFYLRKLEGADILLADETNFLRMEVYKWAPMAPHPPPLVTVSLSTRKRRPTKQQRLMAQLGIEKPEDLPPPLRPKQRGTKKEEKLDIMKSGDKTGGPSNSQRSHTPPGLPHGHSNASSDFVSD